MKKLSVTISGRVQGVGFRNWVRKTAIELGISGFVKNNDDGSVYAEIFGDEEPINEFLKRAHLGPSLAKVETVSYDEGDVANTSASASDFKITDFKIIG